MISILKNYVRESILNNLSEDMTEDLISLFEGADGDGILEEGLKIFVWTINDIKTYEKVIEETKKYSNQIYYITDYPNILCSTDIKNFIKI
jgi:hypothetical protein